MSDVRGTDEKVIAILCADIHLSLNPPIWRSVEEDWFWAMQRPLVEIKKIQQEHDCTIICAGDIFDKWNSPPELINFALKHLPNMYAVPGQHDLPLHNYDDIEKSAYWTLVKAGKINPLPPKVYSDHKNIIMHGFPFGYPVKPITKIEGSKPQIAVVHEYACIEGLSYSNAPSGSDVAKRKAKFIDGKIMGYDVIVYGDNHKGFYCHIGDTHIFNCGSLMRRNSDQIDYKPQVGLLLSSGEVIPHYLDISKDKYIDTANTLGPGMALPGMKEYIEELEKLGDTDLDFLEAMKQYLKTNNVKTEIANVILGAMGL